MGDRAAALSTANSAGATLAGSSSVFVCAFANTAPGNSAGTHQTTRIIRAGKTPECDVRDCSKGT